MLGRLFTQNKDLALVLGMIGILLVLFTPIPPTLLDLLIIVNLAFALTIFLLTFYVARPVEFSTFPSLLLVATLYRLALNVAATRLILTGADAGEVIGSIGSFAVQGNFVIGLVVFFILVVVQFVVVTSGAQRVSEVAARFVLDAVPGQQMSIDADLNMGLIDQNEAKRRRKDLEKEASFYGAMDGASKFVKGDAVAGIIILLIDIIAGWIVGVVQMDMEWKNALSTFTLLTIGDGIVTQVPALIISVATGIIVTRSASDRQLSVELFSQLGSVPKVPLIVMGALTLLLALPGMPKWPIMLLAIVAASAYRSLRRRNQSEADEGLFDAKRSDDEKSEAKGVAPIEILLGRELSREWETMRPLLAERITGLRNQQEEASGLLLPPVVFNDSARLGATDYEIRLFGARHGHGQLQPRMTMAIGTMEKAASLPGIEARDPAFGLPALWIEHAEAEHARDLGFTLVDPLTVLMTHAGEIFRIEASQLLSRRDVVVLLEGVRTRQPGLIEELVPAVMTVSDIQRVMQDLLTEEVPIRYADQIIETLVDVGRTIKDRSDLVEAVRQRLAHGICDHLRGRNPDLSVLSLDPRIEGQLTESVRRAEPGNAFLLEPRFAEQLLRGLAPKVEAMIRQSLAPVLLCSPEIRRHLKTFTRRSLPKLSVLSVNEIPHTVDVRSFSVVTLS